MTCVFGSSDLDQIVDEMITHMMAQIENPALINSRFRFDQVLHLDISFHRLKAVLIFHYRIGWLKRRQ